MNFFGTHHSDFFISEHQEDLWARESSVIDMAMTDINEEKIRLPNSKVIDTVVTRSPLILADGSKGLVGIVHDISHLKEVEQQLGKHKQNLEELVAEQTVTLKNALQEAETASELKSDFLANMSHELRTPLNSIIGMAGLLLEDGLSNEQQEMMRTLEGSSKNLLDIVNDILDLSKIESGALELEHIPFDAQQTVSDVINMLKPLASKKGLTLNWHGKEFAPIFIMGDPLRYSRIVTNITSNAVKYSENGQVDIRLDVDTIDDQHRILKLMVKDNGIGIAEDSIDKIFGKFTQADTSTTRKYGGTGLGLAITKQLVEKMDGEIKVESEVGVGSTFTITIPFAVADTLERNEEQVIALNQCGIIPPETVKVLVAEDHLLNQVYIRKLLQSIGIRNINVVENGKLALEWVQEHSVDVVLMDCHMPEMNGYDATAAIRSLEQGDSRLPIVALTANAMPGERERCISVGMDDYLSKPVDKSQLIKMLSNWIRFESNTSDRSNADPDEVELPVLDLASIRSFSGDDKDLEREFAKIFIEQSEKQLATLREHIVDGQSKAWVETAHLLKGGSATIGAMRMCKQAAKVQEMFVSNFADREAAYFLLEESFVIVKQELINQELYTQEDQGEAA